MIFSFVAEAVDTGTSVWNISDLSVLLHDGKGTPAHTRIVNHSIIVEEKITINEELYVSVQDVEPPEKFTLYIDRSPEIFDNATFVVFSAQDKNSGIDYYEILESKRKIQNYDSDVWNAAQSPYLLEDQLLESYIYVRAVDRAGNTRLAVHTPDHGKSISISIILYALYALLFVYVLMYFIRRKKDK